jgi:hypothetical protein
MLVVCHISAAVAAADQMQGGWVGGAGAASHRSLPHDNTLTFACGRTVTPGNWSSITARSFLQLRSSAADGSRAECPLGRENTHRVRKACLRVCNRVLHAEFTANIPSKSTTSAGVSSSPTWRPNATEVARVAHERRPATAAAGGHAKRATASRMTGMPLL